jgi:hypothetical protein
MNESDYTNAWNLIATWRDEGARAAKLNELRSSERRPYVAYAMVRISAMMANASEVSEGFCKQLASTSFADCETGILDVTDQILNAVNPDQATWNSIASISDLFAAKELEAQQDAARGSRLATASNLPTVEQVAPVKTLEPVSEKVVRLDEAPIFARVRVVRLGLLDTEPENEELLGATVITWTNLETSDNVFSEVEVRGLLTPENEVAWTVGELSWLSGDAEVEIIDPPRYAGQPEELIPLAQPVKPPANVGSRDSWPPLIWRSMPLYRALVPLDDALDCVQTLLCALSVSPPTFDVQPYLLAGLKARYAKVLRNSDIYSEREYRWRYADGPDLTYSRWTS